jgi:hypothetical protein
MPTAGLELINAVKWFNQPLVTTVSLLRVLAFAAITLVFCRKYKSNASSFE